MIDIAIAIPHTPWIKHRAENIKRIFNSIDPASSRHNRVTVSLFTDRDTWAERSEKKWDWGVNYTHFCSLEDDTVLAPNFSSALLAMVEAWPEDLISLASTHSLGPAVAEQGRRSYYSNKLLGWGWACPRSLLYELYHYAIHEKGLQKYLDSNKDVAEDHFILDYFINKRKPSIIPRTPVPSIVDHLFQPSTNGSEYDWHTHTKTTVTWRGYKPEDMANPEWWKTPTPYLYCEPTLTSVALRGPCQWCGQNEITSISPNTKMGICGQCLMAPFRVFKTGKKEENWKCREPGCEEIRTGPVGVHAFCWKHLNQNNWADIVQSTGLENAKP